LRQADAFILPSFSEGLPMSVLEAMAYRLPVLMTDHCNLPEGFAAEAAVRIGTGLRGQPMGIDEGMCTLMEMSDSERVAMGQRGRALVEERFTWPQVAAQMKEVYEWVLGGGETPGCVMKP
jgi:poly(glycerol-phosphate) alpha-glucosyltransferase